MRLEKVVGKAGGAELEIIWFNSPGRKGQSVFLYKQKSYSNTLGRLIVENQMGFFPPVPADPSQA